METNRPSACSVSVAPVLSRRISQPVSGPVCFKQARHRAAEEHAHIVPTLYRLRQRRFAGEIVQVLHNGQPAADVAEQHGFLQRGVTAANEHDVAATVKVAVADGAIADAVACQSLFTGDA